MGTRKGNEQTRPGGGKGAEEEVEDMFPYYLLLAAIFRPEVYRRYRKEKEAEQALKQDNSTGKE